jgi:hypothetical protein
VSDAHTTDALASNFTKQWQWPSTSASAKAVSRRTLDPLTVPAAGSSCDTSAEAQSEAAAPAQLPACCPANLNVSPDAASPTLLSVVIDEFAGRRREATMTSQRDVDERDGGSADHNTRERLLAELPVTERRIQLAGISSAVLEGGDGPPVILLHGPESSRLYGPSDPRPSDNTSGGRT